MGGNCIEWKVIGDTVKMKNMLNLCSWPEIVLAYMEHNMKRWELIHIDLKSSLFYMSSLNSWHSKFMTLCSNSLRDLSWILLLMIPKLGHHHVRCIKPCRQWAELPTYQLVIACDLQVSERSKLGCHFGIAKIFRTMFGIGLVRRWLVTGCLQ